MRGERKWDGMRESKRKREIFVLSCEVLINDLSEKRKQREGEGGRSVIEMDEEKKIDKERSKDVM